MSPVPERPRANLLFPPRRVLPGTGRRSSHTALRLFTRYGVDATPTSRISKEAGVSTGTLFHYFPDKDNLVGALYISIKKEMAGADPEQCTTRPCRQSSVSSRACGVSLHGAWQTRSRSGSSTSATTTRASGRMCGRQIYDEFSWMAGLMQVCDPRGPPAGPAVRVPWHDGVPDHERDPRPDRIRGVRHVE